MIGSDPVLNLVERCMDITANNPTAKVVFEDLDPREPELPGCLFIDDRIRITSASPGECYGLVAVYWKGELVFSAVEGLPEIDESPWIRKLDVYRPGRWERRVHALYDELDGQLSFDY